MEQEDIQTKCFRQYPTNIIYNRDLQFCQFLVDVPRLQSDAIQASSRVREILWRIELTSVERCLIQLLYLFSLVLDERSAKGVDFGLRSVQRITLALVRYEKPCAPLMGSAFQSSLQGEVEEAQEGYNECALKLVVWQNTVQDCTPDNLFVWRPFDAFHRTLDVLKPLVSLLPEERINGINYRDHFEKFFFAVKQITGKTRMSEVRLELEMKSELINQNSCYCAMKSSSFSDKIACFDVRIKPYLQQEINEACFQEIIGIRIDKVLYSRENWEEQNGPSQRMRESSIPIFLFHYSQSPQTNQTRLKSIEMEHSDLPIVEVASMDRLMKLFSDDMQSIRLHESGRLFSSRNLSFNTELGEKDLLTIMERLYLRGNLLRIRINCLLNNQITKKEFRRELTHYNKMIERKIAMFSTPQVHRYVEELQRFRQA